MRKRQPQQLQVVLAEQIHVGDRGAGVHPRLVTQPHPFGFAGRPRGVNQRRQPVGGHLLGDGANAGGVVGQVLRALLGEIVQRDHPVAVTGSVEHHHLGEIRQVAATLGELPDLLVVFGEDDPRLGVGEDVGGVLGVGTRVDSGGRRAGAHDRQVGQDPLEPGGRCDTDPILGRDTQRQQAGCQGVHPLGRLLPGDRGPAAVLGVSEGFLVCRCLDALQEQHRQIRCLGGRRGEAGLAHRTSFCALSNLATPVAWRPAAPGCAALAIAMNRSCCECPLLDGQNVNLPLFRGCEASNAYPATPRVPPRCLGLS